MNNLKRKALKQEQGQSKTILQFFKNKIPESLDDTHLVAISDNTNATVINENSSELNINLNTNADCSISTPVSIVNMDEYKTAKSLNDIGLFVNCSERIFGDP
ncbi:uncharacterized protein LOC132940633 [Metopolophium dirhodum]|uniref:uncharacterized protein LOC132940633 n=1 Tax=Metopolophium dirhodum TaxID=44670 RepID=UPI00298FF398|nr:uncharacterized protein LOC132940633 [Metopolophium dirhodum]